MAGNLVPDQSGDVLVELDYDNIIVVDPNKTIDANGNIRERLVDPENLVMYANLEAELLPRTKLAVGASPDDSIRTISIASINFLRGNKDNVFTTGYYDELTGKNATLGKGSNQTQNTAINNGTNKPYIKSTVLNNGDEGAVDNGLLGITSINVRISTSFIPSVTIEMEDVQGRALFQLGQNSPYSAFFNLPYPPFYLTLKGYYGQAIRYQLNLVKFNARFNSFSGNYQVSLELVGYKFNILNEIALGHLLATPHMYSKNFEVGQITDNKSVDKSVIQSSRVDGESKLSATNNTTVKTTQLVSEKGYQKIREVYSEYKAKNLIPADFPELTLQQLMNKMDMFEKTILDSYSKADVEPLTNIRNYKNTLQIFYNKVYNDPDSWFTSYCDPKPFILKDGRSVYVFKKKTFTPGEKKLAIEKLNQIILEYRNELNSNATIGSRGVSPVVFSITTDTIVKNNISGVDVEPAASAKEQFGTTTADPNLETINKIISSIFQPKLISSNQDGTKKTTVEYDPVFSFSDFQQKIRVMESEVNRKLGAYETAITTDLANKLESKSLGIGFRPSVRNVMAVIMASAEGFIRLLDEVHTNAWNVRFDPIRKNVILNNPSSAPSSDAKNYLPTSQSTALNNDQIKNAQIPVYPWPQFFVETNEDKKGRFQLKYLGDPGYVDQTKGYLYEKWPEVEFVEEYLKGLTQKFNPPIDQPPQDSNAITNILNINALEFPQTNLAYANKEEVKFFYEIWERQYLTAYYTGLWRAGNAQFDKLLKGVMDFESQNIVTSLGGSNPYLAFKLKNYPLNSQIYPQFLRTISNDGTGRFYQEYVRDFFVTPYIRNYLANPTSIIPLSELGPIPQINKAQLSEEIKQVISTIPNDPTVMDIYPFTSLSWCETNLVGIQETNNLSRYNTKNVLTVYQPRNVISNFEDTTNNTKNRPVTNFGYLNPTYNYETIQSEFGINTALQSLGPVNFPPTVGWVYNDSPARRLSGERFVDETIPGSMLNTPYFINAIQKGVDQYRRGGKNPYKTAAYLFLNSLPLITLREKVKSREKSNLANGTVTSDNLPLNSLDYFYATLKKFGAVHKLPYAYLLKTGSIWHRYKTFKETGVDIINDVWTNFDFVKNYDPKTNNLSKTYSYTKGGVTYNIQLQNVTTEINTMNVGFYPKLITDFNVFYNGFDLFSGYTNQEVQGAVNNGMKLYNFIGSNFTSNQGTTPLRMTTTTVTVPANLKISVQQKECKPPVTTVVTNNYIMPSFGSKVNQVPVSLMSALGTPLETVIPGYSVTSNGAVFNGSVKLFWSSPNYGYFDNSKIVKPSPDSYITQVSEVPELVTPFALLNRDTYTKIDDLLSVFDKTTLDLFEEEFLKFSKPETDVEIGVEIPTPFDSTLTDPNFMYKNFQIFFKNLVRVSPQKTNESDEDYFKRITQEQFSTIKQQITGFLEYDVFLRIGNPSGYNRRVFASYLTHNTTTNPQVVDPIRFEPYVPNTLPSSTNTITLQQSKINLPKEWLALELNVGFSTIPQLEYSNKGSYITDFFIDNNIKFTVENIEILTPLIKIYATQKLATQNITPQEFRNRLESFLTNSENVQDYFINGVLNKVNKDLPSYSQVPEGQIKSVVDGKESKVEDYEMFKALNDKWIAGGDFSNKTLFEDVLFLDRASRNIGDTLLLDIFDLKNVLNQNSLNMNMSVYTFMAGILVKNNFTIMNLPAYVNFYNVQNADGVTSARPEGSLDFANNMWGTFLNVDYRNSSPKMVCFYVGRPSNYLQLPDNKNYMFKDDGFEMRRASENPLLENLTNKQDWALSNRCVGFNVDIGIRNQNVFNSFSVSQDTGKATSESVNSTLNMINQANGTQSATQNQGLYNLYKQRSYSCSVVSMGNALIQPTMYFNLRHVPMFNGPYMITEVSHTIGPGEFTTTFTGVRQGIFDLPSIDKYLQSINQNLLTKLESIILNKKDQKIVPNNTNGQKSANKETNANNTSQPTESCSNYVLPIYLTKGYESVPTVETKLNPKQVLDKIDFILRQRQGTPDPTLKATMYSICYISTFKNGVFNGYNNNFALQITLENDFRPTSDVSFQKQYCCFKNQDGKNIKPSPVFSSDEDFFSFLYSRLANQAQRIKNIGLWKYYYCYFPKNGVNESYFDKYKKEDPNMKNSYKNLNEGLNSVKTLGVDVGDIPLFLEGPPPVSQPNNTQQSTVTCAKPDIISFTPTTAKKDQPSPQITISGTSLWGNAKVFVGPNTCIITENTDTKIVAIPQTKSNGKIKVVTSYGEDETQNQFTFT